MINVVNTITISKAEENLKLTLTQIGPQYIHLQMDDSGHTVEMTLGNDVAGALIDSIHDMLERVK